MVKRKRQKTRNEIVERAHDAKEPVECVGLDPDSAIYIFQFLPFESLLQVRLVSKFWSQCGTSNRLWEHYYTHHFGPHPSSQQKIHPNEWFTRFLEIAALIPRIDYIDNGTESSEFSIDERCSEAAYERHEELISMHLYSNPVNVSEKVHRLAAFLSILASNEFIPKVFSDNVLLGFEKKWHIRIPLSRFCLAVLRGEEMKLLEGQGGMDREKLEAKKHKLALCPDVEVFSPFVYLSRMKGYPDAYSLRLLGFKPNQKIEVFRWKGKDDEPWAPEFFNASFNWSETVTKSVIITGFHESGTINALKLQEKLKLSGF